VLKYASAYVQKMDIFTNSEKALEQKVINEKDDKRNFILSYLNGVFASIGFRLIDSNMVLPAFIKQLTNSNVMVGLVSSTMSAGSIWLQMLMSNLMEHRPRKMPFYTFGVVIRLSMWAFIILFTLLIGNSNNALLFVGFYSLYFTFCSSLGISNLPFNDIVAKAIPAKRIARLFSFRQFTGEAFGIGVGLLIKFILGERCYLAFPYNYAVIFLIGFVALTISGVVFIAVKEPIEPVPKKRKPFWQHLKIGPHFLKTDRNYRSFMLYRIVSSFGAMSIPFYVPYAIDRMQIHASTIGTFTAVGAVSALFSNLLWGYIGEKKGSRNLMVIASTLACIAPIVASCVKYLPSHSQITAYLLVFVVNQAFTSASGVAYMTYSLNMAPSMNRPSYLGFLNTLMFPLGFTSLLAGALLKVIPYEFMFFLSAILSAVAVYSATRLLEVDRREKKV
jgi:MFS family permease